MTDTDHQKMIDKVRKLRALAEDSGATEHEAAAAAAKMQDLLFQYNLDIAELDLKEDQPDAIERQDADEIKLDTWRGILLNTVAEHNFCRCLKGRAFILVGKPHNVEVVRYMYSYLERELERLAENAWKRQLAEDEMEDLMAGVPPPPRSKSRFKTSFYHAATSVIGKRLREQRRANMEASSDSKALVIVSDHALDKALKEMFPGMRGGRAARYRMDGAGYNAGRSAGANVGLHGGLSGRSANPGGRRQLGA